jgi:putative flippase GtrA
VKTKFLRFLLLSGLSFLVNLGLTVGLHELLGVPERWSFAIALVTVFAMNFLLLRHCIYDGRQGSIQTQLAGYTASAGAFRLLEYLAFLLLLGWLDADYRLVVVSVLAVSAILKFLTYRFLFEGHRRDLGA